nr:reverse transcriptase domain-containing protein [Tanacetum cinerariifolium]
MTPPPGFSTPPQIPNINISERPPVTTTVFAATTPENTPFAYRASTLANPNPMIRYAFDYDEKREMEPRPEPTKESTPPLQLRSPGVCRQQKRVVGFEESPNKEGSKAGRNAESSRPSEIEARENGNRGMNLPPTLGSSLSKKQKRLKMVTPLRGKPSPIIHKGGLSSPEWTKMPSYIGSYDGKGDLDNFLHLFEGAIRMQKWLMPVACHMFTYTLKDSARIWWNSQKASSILNYKDLKAKLRSQFSQQKKFTKTHLAVHNIKQREGEIREVGTNGTPNDRRENFERSKKSSQDNIEDRKAGIEKVARSFEQPPRMFGSRRSRDMSKYYHFYEDHGNYTNDCCQLKSQIKEALKSWQLSHLVKGIKKEQKPSKINE